MPTEQEQDLKPIPSLALREIAEILVKHYGLHEGKYDLQIEFQLGMGGVGPDKESPLPGVMIGVSRIGLRQTQGDSPGAVDAALVNPKKRPRKTKS